MDTIDIIRKSKFFDRKYYLETYKDIENISMSPEAHYLEIGYLEGRNPSPLFSSYDYLMQHSDLLHDNLNPLLHYELYGRKENVEVVPVDSLGLESSSSIFDNIEKLSVILYLTDNDFEYDVRTALNSIFEQEYSNLDVVIIDDGISNYSYNVILEFINKYNNIKLICDSQIESIKNRNYLHFGSAIKTALDQCCGRYVLFLTGSDYYTSSHFFSLNAFIQSNSGIELILNDILPIGNVRKIAHIYKCMNDNAEHRMCFHFSCCCCLKNVLLRVDFSNVNSMLSLFSEIKKNIVLGKKAMGWLPIKTFVKLNPLFSIFSCFDESLFREKTYYLPKKHYVISYCINKDILNLSNYRGMKSRTIVDQFVNLAEFLITKKAYLSAIKVFSNIYNYLGVKCNNILYRMFDCYIVEKDLIKADNILQSIVTTDFETSQRCQYMNDILNSSKAEKFDVSFKDFEIENNLLSERVFKHCKARELVNYSLIFSKDLPRFSSFVIDNLNKTRLYIEPQLKENNNYELSINLLTAERVGILVSKFDIVWLFKVSKEVIISILRGKDNWLFLDNDSNQSVEQFVGKKSISDAETKNWRKYLNFVKHIKNFILLIPPSKEEVFPEYYPFNRADYCSVDKLKSMVEEQSITFLYPKEQLQEDKTSYTKTDTHWSYKAACSVFFNILRIYNIEHSGYVLPYTFKLEKWIGDLGSKCFPHECADLQVIDTSINPSKVLFTNFVIHNQQGRIIKYYNATAFINKKIIIYGDSYNLFLFPFFTSFFSDVVTVWSNATIIEEILKYEKPDYVIAEMAERFIVSSPLVLSEIRDYKPCVRLDLTQRDIYHIKNFVHSDLPSVYSDYMQKYSTLL